VKHVSFGTVLGVDGKPFKTRSGETVPLIALLTAAIDRATAVVGEKNPGMPADEITARAREVGIGAVKYADLSNGRTRDYVFDLDRMVSLTGNTGVYLQYAHARVRSILRKATDFDRNVFVDAPLLDAERRLALRLDEFGEIVSATGDALEPHRLCAYLFELAQTLSAFWEACPVLTAPDHRVRANRLALCQLTADTLRLGLSLLGIGAPERL
jgi:arginyl-tRNA synthetase